MSSLGGSGQADVSSQERLRAVHRHAQRAARELDHERADSVLNLARAFGAIDRGEVVAQLEARLGFLERQVERLAGRREQVDRAVHGELQIIRTRVTDAIRIVEAAGEADRKARLALEARVRSMLEESERRSALAAQALRDLVAEIRRSLEAQVAATLRAAQALTESAFAGVVDRLQEPGPGTAALPPARTH